MKSASEKSSSGATFSVVCGILVAVALLQAALGLWGWQKQLASREASLPVNSGPTPQAPMVAAQSVSTPAPVTPPAGAKEVADVSNPTPPVKISPPVRTVENPRPFAKTLDVKITDESILELLDQGTAAREKGDMQTALEAIRAAWLKQPDHPKLIYQLARTMDKMGLESKAQPHWNTLIKLGRAAGDFYHLAELQIKQNGIATPEPSEVEKSEGKIAITDVRIEKVPGVYSGQKKLLSFTLKKIAPEPIPSDSILAGIHFFDLVNGTRIARTVATVQAQKISAPEDWTERGLERWEVLWDLAEMTPADIVQYGQCKYYGFALKIFLTDPDKPQEMGLLQDMVAEPAELKGFANDMPVPVPPTADTEAADAMLFPK